MIRVLKIIVFCFIGLILTFVLNYFVIEKLLIPNPCYYHSRDASQIFDLFYELPTSAGCHPVPTILNLTLTLLTGISGGLIFGIRQTTK
jgi:hypothetical protein